ncbi:MAG: hypothetical protein ACYTG4_05515 [Planctomycetota bacterium]|jgi:hypothetical protein
MTTRRLDWMFSLAAVLLLAMPIHAQDMEGDGMDGDGTGMEATEGGEKKPALGKKLDGPAPGTDHLHLKDGRLLKGRITAEDDEAYAVKVGATIRVISKSDVDRIEKGPPAPKKPATTQNPRDAKRERAGKKNLTPAALDWANRCIEWAQSDDPAVRRSAAAALTNLGPAVVPHVRSAMKKAEGPYREMLSRIADQAAKTGDMTDRKKRSDPATDLRRFTGRLARSLKLEEDQRAPFASAFGKYLRDTRVVVEEVQGGFIAGDEAIRRAGELRTTLRGELEGTLSTEQLDSMDKQLDKYSRKLGAGKNAPNKGKKKNKKSKKKADDATN